MKPLLRRGATLKAKLVSNKLYKWHTPIVVPCTSPLDAPEVSLMTDVVEKFNNPDETSVEFDPTKINEVVTGGEPAMAGTGTTERPR